MKDTEQIIITVDTDGTTDIFLKGFEEQSPEIARSFEAALGTVDEVKWAPKAHAHTHTGAKQHTH
jgi:hypothetical protein